MVRRMERNGGIGRVGSKDNIEKNSPLYSLMKTFLLHCHL